MLTKRQVEKLQFGAEKYLESVRGPLNLSYDFDRWIQYRQKYATAPGETGSSEPVVEKVQRVFQMVEIAKSISDWWDIQGRKICPDLAGVAKRVSAFPLSTASVERMFSTVGWIHSSRRASLTSGMHV